VYVPFFNFLIFIVVYISNIPVLCIYMYINKVEIELFVVEETDTVSIQPIYVYCVLDKSNIHN
jgi:hypothetical protein